MACLHKIQISGIRSFSPQFEDAQSISFEHPLTVILGRNGAGKTTIIEACLNATTGELPVGADKGSFVHDPRVLGEREVRGQIRLGFRANTGQDMQVVRTFQSSVKKNKVTTQTIDASLSYRDTKTNKTTSGTFRCSDIDKIIPDLLGVCSSVLKNVIFCHQEDASWCFGTPLEVKKRLDDIFSSTKYVSALEKLRETAKFYRQEMKQCEASMLLLEEYASQAHKMRQELHEKEEISANLSHEALRLEEEHRRLVSALSVCQKWFQEIERFRSEISRVDIVVHEKVQSIKRLRGHSDESKEPSLEEIEHCSSQNESKLKDLLRDKKRAEEALRENQESINKASSESSIADANILKIENDVLSFSEKMNQIESDLISFAKQYAYQLPEVTSENILQCIQDVLGFLHTQIDSLQKERKLSVESCDESLSAVESELNDVFAEHRCASVRNTDFLTKIAEEDRSLQLLQEECVAAGKSLGASSVAEERKALVVLQEQFRVASGELHVETLEKDVLSMKNEVQEAEEEFQQINDKMRVYMDSKEKLSTLRVLQHAKSEKQGVVLKKKSELKTLIPLLDSDSVSACLTKLNDEYEALVTTQASLQKGIIKSERLIATHENEQSKLRKAVEGKSNLASSMRSKFENLFGQSADAAMADPVNTMARFDADFERLNAAISTNSGSVQQLNEMLEHLHNAAACMMCERGFEKKDEEAIFKQSLCDKIREIEKTQSTDSEKIHDMREKKAIIQAHLAEVLQYVTMVNEELPTAQTSLAQVEKALDVLYKEKENLLQEEKNISSKLQTKKKTLSLAEDISSIEHEITGLQEQIHAAGGSEHSESDIDIVCADHKSMDDRLSQLRRSLQQSETTCVNAKQKLDGMRNLIASKSQEIETLERTTQNYTSLQSKISEKTDFLRNLGLEKESSTQQIEVLSGKLADLKENIRSQKEKRDLSASRIDESIREALQIEKRLSAFQEQHSHLNTHTQPDAIRQAKEALQKVLEQKGLFEDIALGHRKILEKIDCEHGEVTAAQQRLVVMRQIAAIKEEVSALEAQKTYFTTELQNTESTARSYFDSLSLSSGGKTIVEMRASIEGKVTDLKSNAARVKGKSEPLSADIAHLKDCLIDAKYNDIERRLASTQIKLATSQAAVHDIEKYHKALDSAVTKYHMDKITELNAIIGQLWSAIYAGSDIDSIAIRVDEDSNSTIQRRSFRYRVVMCRGDFELDFRGRCSAGQKVLASVIIRLALSEAFCCDCGILALDEPTTNLDEENIIALAKALRKIIESRRHVKNFQIVVITHDESFVRALGHSELCDFYYYVHKTVDGKYSQIERQPISSLSRN